MHNSALTGSDMLGHNTGLADVGNPATFWQAAVGDTRCHHLALISLTLPVLGEGFSSHHPRQNWRKAK